MKKRRSDPEMILRILQIINGGSVNQTRIVYQANTNTAKAKRMINLLIKEGCIAQKGKLYKATEKGVELRKELEWMIGTIENFEAETKQQQFNNEAR